MKVAFIGQVDYRDRELTVKLTDKVKKIVEKLIVENGAEEFLFASGITFNRICLDVVTELKIKYPHIRRIFITMYKVYRKRDRDYLMKCFDSLKEPENSREKGQFPSIKANQKIIDECDYLIAYYDKNAKCKYCYYEDVKISLNDNQTQPKSEIKVALNYAFSNNVDFVNLFEEQQNKYFYLFSGKSGKIAYLGRNTLFLKILHKFYIDIIAYFLYIL